MTEHKLADEVGISLDEAALLLARYKAAFPTVMRFLDAAGDKAKQTLQTRTIAGRRRRWKLPSWQRAKEVVLKECQKDKKPFSDDRVRRKYAQMYGSIEREGKNAPIQGANADATKLAMAYAWESLESKFGAQFLNTVHDEVVVECPENVADECFHYVGSCMTKAGTMFLNEVQMLTEGHIGDYWSK